MPTEVMTKPICKTVTCKKELTFLDDSKCWRCLICNPLPKEEPAPPKEKKPFLDVHITEERVREIVRDELENWHIQKPPVTAVEAKKIDSALRTDWRVQAKELGIPLFQRKKADVLKDIEDRLDETFNK